jgi:hypothetical protein
MEVVLKAFSNVNEEVKDRFGRLKEILSSDKALATQLKIMKAVDLALDPRSYFGQEGITDKGLSQAIDLVEFVGIIRSFEEYIMPLDTVADSSGKSSSSSAFSSSAPKSAIMGVLYKDNAPVAEYIIINDAKEEVLTAKGKVFMEIHKSLSSKNGDSIGWLMLFMAIANALGMDEEHMNRYINANLNNPKEVAEISKELTEFVWEKAELANVNNLITYYNSLTTEERKAFGDNPNVFANNDEIMGYIKSAKLKDNKANENIATGIKVSGIESLKDDLVKSKVITDFRKRIEEDSSLSIGGKLTQKGKMLVEIAERFLNEEKEWQEFLLKGPLGQFILSGKTALNFKLDYETALQITNELWKANIWDFEQVNMVYGFYKVIPGERWSSVITSLNQLKGILTARHSNVKKELAKNKGYKLPDAMVIELAKLTEGISFSDKGYEEYFKNMRELNENVEEGVKRSIEINNFKSEVSISEWPKAVRSFVAFVRMIVPWGGTKGTKVGQFNPGRSFKGLQDAVFLDISKARELYNLKEGVVEEGKTEEEKFIEYISPLMCIAGVRPSKEALSNFKTILEFAKEHNDVNAMVNVSFYEKTWFKGVVTAGIIGLCIALSIFVPPLIVGVVLGVGVVIGFIAGVAAKGFTGFIDTIKGILRV